MKIKWLIFGLLMALSGFISGCGTIHLGKWGGDW